MVLKAPFPYFGGKSKVATEVWDRFGDVKNYVEPFCGSAAVLLARPTEPKIETVNDANCFIANFWRALQADPEAVAHFADWPVNEADLHARHRWLMLSESSADWRERMKTDPDFYDAQIAGWWVWGASCWIGAGWCDGGRLFGRDGGTSNKKPETRVRRGVSTAIDRKRPSVTNSGRGDTAASLSQQLPAVDTAGNGIHGATVEGKRPRLTGWGGAGGHRQMPNLSGDSGAAARGVHASGLTRKLPAVETAGGGIHRKIPELGSSRGDASALGRQLPHVGGSGRGDTTALGLDADRRRPELSAANGRGVTTANASAILAWFVELERRLRRVRVVCGDWTRVCTPAVTHGIGLTAVFLDPPYSRDAGRTAGIYSEDDDQVAHRVREWAIENGGNQDLRIALCGYEGEHEMPGDWTRFEWAAQGGYANQRKSGDGYANRLRERIYFSPHCLGAVQERLIA